MGGMFSKHFSKRQQRHPEAKPEAVTSKSSGQGSISIFEMMKPECLKTKKTKRRRTGQSLNQPEKTITKARMLTLEEWLVNSPAPNSFNNNKPECFSGGELHVFKHSSRRVHPSLPSSSSSSSSSSSRTRVEVDREAKAEAAAASTSRPRDSFNCSLDVSTNPRSSLSRSQSGKLKKKVSFRLPEEADIIIFYSPEDTPGSDYQSF